MKTKHTCMVTNTSKLFTKDFNFLWWQIVLDAFIVNSPYQIMIYRKNKSETSYFNNCIVIQPHFAS